MKVRLSNEEIIEYSMIREVDSQIRELVQKKRKIEKKFHSERFNQNTVVPEEDHQVGWKQTW